jgi:hypothetical protein
MLSFSGMSSNDVTDKTCLLDNGLNYLKFIKGKEQRHYQTRIRSEITIP